MEKKKRHVIIVIIISHIYRIMSHDFFKLKALKESLIMYFDIF